MNLNKQKDAIARLDATQTDTTSQKEKSIIDNLIYTAHEISVQDDAYDADVDYYYSIA